MFRTLVLGLTLFCSPAQVFATNQQIVNCALLSNEQILEAIKVLTPIELKQMALTCADQRDMFVIVADEQTDAFERRRYMRYANRAGIASEQFWEAFRMSFTRR